MVRIQHFVTVELKLGIINSTGELIQQSKSNRIPIEFDLSGCLQSWCQQCISVGKKTGTYRAVL